MGESDTSRQFAYGKDKTDGVPCPAMVANDDVPHGDNLVMAERYDEIAAENEENPTGYISIEQAAEYWEKAIEQLDSEGYVDAAEAGREIEAEVFA